MPISMYDVLQVQGEMDVDGGQPEMGAEVGGMLVVVSWVLGCRVVVVMLQLVKPIGFRLEKVVPLEQVPPLAFIKS